MEEDMQSALREQALNAKRMDTDATPSAKESPSGSKDECCKEAGDEHCEIYDDVDEAGEPTLRSLEAENESLRARNKEIEENYLRVHADFENSKKRLEKDKYTALEYAYESMAKDLLPTLDTLDKALEEAQKLSDGKEVAIGIEHTIGNLLKALNKHGIEVVPVDGDFDPNLHDAIMQVDSDKPKGSIVATLQKGYRYKERTLRPALVSVSK